MSEEVLNVYKVWTADDGSNSYVLVLAQSAGHARRIVNSTDHMICASEFVAATDKPGIIFDTDKEKF